MRRVVVAVLLGACGHPAATAHDAAGRCPPAPTSPPPCSQTCGNNVIDQCTTMHPDESGCPSYTVAPESCDGTDVPATCVDFGYYGGSAACSSNCLFDLTGCDACAPGLTCVSFHQSDPLAIAASGANVGMLAESPWAILSFAELDTSLHSPAVRASSTSMRLATRHRSRRSG